MRSFARSLVKSVPDIAVSLGATLACFLLFLALLAVTFREGTSLGELMSDRATRTAWGAPAERGGIDITTAAGIDEVVAILSVAENSVKDKAATELAWSVARSGTPLKSRHSVQTFDHSRAVISFDSRNELEIGENSLVVVKRHHRSATEGTRRTSLMVLGGELEARLSNALADSVQLDVETPRSARLRLDGRSGDPTAFRVHVQDDGGSAFTVYEGRAEVEVNGTTRQVEANQMVSVDTLGAVSEPVSLPGTPVLRAPSAGSVIVFREQSPRIESDWSTAEPGAVGASAGAPEADSWQFVLATDPALSRILHRERLAETRLTFGNLEPGELYWGVAAIAGGVVGRAATGGPIHVQQDRLPPSLDVAFPHGEVAAASLTLRGATEPGAKVFVDDAPIPTSEEGTFEIRLKLNRGLNLIVVESVDAAGNATYRSQTITARY